MTTSTVNLHRIIRAPAERLYRAFLEPEALARWLPPYGFTCQVEQLEARVGGCFRMAFTNFASGERHAFDGEYHELVSAQRIRYSDVFDDPNLSGEMQTTVVFNGVSCGTEITVVQAGIPEGIPVELCYLGWQQSLAQLALLVEPEIPG